MTVWTDVAAVNEVVEGEIFAARAGNIPLALFRLGAGFHALYDLCPHGAARLSDGFVEADCVECPLHQGLIDIATGAARSAPITGPTRSFALRVAGTRLEVALDDG